MAQFPGLTIWTDAWIADTKHLHRCVRGTYMDLLILMWRTPGCRVPSDDAWLANRLALTVEEVRAELRPVIAEFCQTDGNWVWQKRLQTEFARAEQRSSGQSARAKSRWDKQNKNAHARGARNAPTATDSPPGIVSPGETIPGRKELLSKMRQVAVADAEYYRRGKEVLGHNAGGMLTSLRRSRGSIAAARAVIEQASLKENPREYVGAVLRGKQTNGAVHNPRDLLDLAYESLRRRTGAGAISEADAWAELDRMGLS